MTTWYVDFENGTDADASSGNGDSFATRRKSINNIVAAALAPGDEIRCMGTTPPSSIGTADWAGQTVYEDRVSITSSTNATPIVITKVGHGLLTGDSIQISGHTTNVNANGFWVITKVTDDTFSLDSSFGDGGSGGGATGYFRKVYNTVKLSYSPCTEVAPCSSRYGNWTASTNITTSFSTAFCAVDDSSLSVAISSSFTTGKACYIALSSLDLSGFQQLSFWMRQVTGTISQDGDLSIALCSDSTGDVPVNSFNIPSSNATGTTAVYPYTVDLATNLGNNINSIAIYVNVDRGAQTFIFSHILACKANADSQALTLTHLIGKNLTTDSFWAIRAIRDNVVWLFTTPAASNDTSSIILNYSGATESVTTYKYTPIPITTTQVISDSGISGSPIIISGGWDRTDMSTQTLETFIGRFSSASSSYIIQANAKSYINISNFSLLGGYRSIYLSSTSFEIILDINNIYIPITGIEIASSCYTLTITVENINQATTAILASQTAASKSVFTLGQICMSNSNSSYGAVYFGSGTIIATITKIDNCTTKGLVVGAAYNEINITSIKFCGYSGIHIQGLSDIYATSIEQNVYGITQTSVSDSNIYNATIQNNITNDLYNILGLYLRNCIFDTYSIYDTNSYKASPILSDKHNQTDSILNVTKHGLITVDTTIRHTASGFSWKFVPSAVYSYIAFMKLPIALEASVSTTISIWVYKTSTAAVGRLFCKQNQLAGLTTLTYSETNPAILSTWQQISIVLTPTETGVVEVEFGVYGDTTAVYIDDLTVS